MKHCSSEQTHQILTICQYICSLPIDLSQLSLFQSNLRKSFRKLKIFSFEINYIQKRFFNDFNPIYDRKQENGTDDQISITGTYSDLYQVNQQVVLNTLSEESFEREENHDGVNLDPAQSDNFNKEYPHHMTLIRMVKMVSYNLKNQPGN
jgi:hypothetical protein